MANDWVDFKAIKESVSMEMVLDHYQINWLRKEKQEMVGRCPIHQGEGERAFHVSMAKNVFNCFSCKARGNVLDFVAAMEKCNVREAAAKLAEWFSVSVPDQGKQKRTTEKEPEPTAATNLETGERPLVNKPLNFQLRNIDHAHPYLVGRGVTRETAEQFGVGFFSGKGSMSGRIVFPIHNEHGELVAYAGRAIDDTEPRYKLPPGFHKSVELFNLHRAVDAQAAEAVVVVEGFFDCMKVSDSGFPCVALMGSMLSAAQEEMICRHFRRVVLLFDGDDAGKVATQDCLLRLGARIWVRAVVLPDGRQPDQLFAEELNRVLAAV